MKDDKKSGGISNTAQEAFTDPAGVLVMGMMDSALGRRQGSFIEDMEARGQRELVAQTTQLPTNGGEDPAWKAMGVVYGEVNAKDPIWTTVTLPSGWALKPTDHAMWSDLVDGHGRVRGKVFYKAAFYDRSCRIHPERRYGQKSEYKDDNWDGARREVAIDRADGEKVLFATEWTEPLSQEAGDDSEKRMAFYKEQDERSMRCRDFLRNTFPDFENPAAYWD